MGKLRWLAGRPAGLVALSRTLQVQPCHKVETRECAGLSAACPPIDPPFRGLVPFASPAAPLRFAFAPVRPSSRRGRRSPPHFSPLLVRSRSGGALCGRSRLPSAKRQERTACPAGRAAVEDKKRSLRTGERGPVSGLPPPSG